MSRHLLVVAGEDKNRFFPLSDTGIVVIGNSHRHCEICLHDLHVNRSHCEIEVDGEQVTVVDLDSDTGTFVNGTRITRQPIQPGDVISLGDSQLRLKLGDGNRHQKHTEETEDDGKTYTLTGPADDPMAALAGTTLAHYQLEALITRGHHGVVYRARDQKSNTTVALKVLSPDFPKSDAEKHHFISAMKTWLPLRHPLLVSLLGTGKSGPYIWLALEHVEGESVASMIAHQGNSGIKDWKLAVRIGLQTGRALAFAHEHQVYHGRVTPGNVLVRAADKCAKLTNLLLGKALEGSHLQQTAFQAELTADLSYLAPEQTHNPKHADAASDLYQLGATMYALLAGRPPFLGTVQTEVVKKIRKGEVARPRQFQPSLPEPFEDLLLKLLAKRPEDRYASANDLVTEIEQLGRHVGSAH